MITHTCDPHQWCAVCDHNERSGTPRNHPSAPRRPAATASPARQSLPVAPCRFIGDELSGSERQARGLDHARKWTHCEHRTKPLGDAVCGCQGCGPRCRGYEVAPPDAPDLPRWHPVPPPGITPTRDRAVITLVIGDDAEQLHAATGPAQRRYAERIGAEYIVIRGATQDRRMMCAEKWRLKDYVPLWDRTLYLDADVWVMPDAPDVFEVVPPDRIGMVNVEPRMPGLWAWAVPEFHRLLRSQGLTPVTPERVYWNSGVWVGSREHAAYWTPPSHPYPAQWCTEEMWCRLQVDAAGLPIHDLDPRFNWTWPEDRAMERVTAEGRPHFFHFAGMGNAEVKEWVQPNRVWRLALLRLLSAVGA
jgi:hypothetical protein